MEINYSILFGTCHYLLAEWGSFSILVCQSVTSKTALNKSPSA